MTCWLGEATDESNHLFRFIAHLSGEPVDNKITQKLLELANIDAKVKDHDQQKRSLTQIARSESERILMKGLERGFDHARGLPDPGHRGWDLVFARGLMGAI